MYDRYVSCALGRSAATAQHVSQTNLQRPIDSHMVHNFTTDSATAALVLLLPRGEKPGARGKLRRRHLEERMLATAAPGRRHQGRWRMRLTSILERARFGLSTETEDN